MARLYHELATLWPLLSPPADYAPEAAQVRAVLRAQGFQFGEQRPDNQPRPTLLELGAGGGHTLSHLSDDFECTAIDLSEQMLAMSRKLNPHCQHAQGDMRTLRLPDRFDCVLIHDAIDYMANPQDAAAAVITAAAHLKPGGVAIFAPTYITETFTDHEGELDVNTSPQGTEVAFLSRVHRPVDQADAFELAMLLMVRVPELGLTIHEDRHTCGLFSVDQWRHFVQGAGLDVSVTSFHLDETDSEDQPSPGREPGFAAELATFDSEAEFPQNIPWFIGRKPSGG